MTALLLALSLSGGAGLWSVGQKGEIVLGDALITEIGFPAYTYVAAGDGALTSSYTDGACRFDTKTGGCVGGTTTTLSILDTAGQEEFGAVVLSFGADGIEVAGIDGNGGPAGVWGDASGHFDFQGGCNMSGGDWFHVRGEQQGFCEHVAGYGADVHCATLGSHLEVDLDWMANLQADAGDYSGAWRMRAHDNRRGTLKSQDDAAVACVAYDDGEPVAMTVLTLRDLEEYVADPSGGKTTGTVGYRGSWVE